MSTADRYTHQRLPVLWDLTDALKRQARRGEERHERRDGEGCIEERERLKAVDSDEHWKEKVKASQGETTKVTAVERRGGCDRGQQMEMCK